jgi:hypothetical protein
MSHASLYVFRGPQRGEVERLFEALRQSEEQIEELKREKEGLGRSEREKIDAAKIRAEDEKR